MGELINLNKVRKARTRAEVEARAGENRARHGRTKAEKATDAARRRKLDQDLAGHKREP